MMGTPRACRSSAGSRPVLPPGLPPSQAWLTTPTAPGSGRDEDLTAPVRAAGRAGDVRQLGLVALRAADQSRRGGLPVRAPRSGVAAGPPPLGNRHVSPPVGRWRLRAESVGRRALGRRAFAFG